MYFYVMEPWVLARWAGFIRRIIEDYLGIFYLGWGWRILYWGWNLLFLEYLYCME